jgi:anti-anti-sigma factor
MPDTPGAPVEQLEIIRTEDPFGVRLVGEIDMATAPMLQEALLVALTEGGPVTVDMKGVTFIDSSGLKVIVSSAAETPSDEPLTVKDPSAVVRRALEVFGMEQIPGLRIANQEHQA